MRELLTRTDTRNSGLTKGGVMIRSTQEVTRYLGVGFTRYSIEDMDGMLYEAWFYQDMRYSAKQRFALDCEPVDMLPDTGEAAAIARARNDDMGASSAVSLTHHPCRDTCCHGH